MISLGEIAKSRLRAEFASLGTDILAIEASGRDSRGMALSDTTRLAEEVPSIVTAAPRITSGGPLTYAGKRMGHATLQGSRRRSPA